MPTNLVDDPHVGLGGGEAEVKPRGGAIVAHLWVSSVRGWGGGVRRTREVAGNQVLPNTRMDAGRGGVRMQTTQLDIKNTMQGWKGGGEVVTRELSTAQKETKQNKTKQNDKKVRS
jgi:hypothetical protein